MLPNLHDSNSHVCAMLHIITLENSLGSFEILLPSLKSRNYEQIMLNKVSEGLEMQNITVDKNEALLITQEYW